MELTHGRRALIDTQASLGVRAGCQLWERFVALSGGGSEVSLGGPQPVANDRTSRRTSGV